MYYAHIQVYMYVYIFLELAYLSPSVGAQVKLTQKLKMNIALGYEIQQLERLKQRTDEYFHTEFKEELSHHSITLKVGLTY